MRWTEQRNFEAVLDMMAEKRIDVGPLISHRFTLDRVAEAYGVVAGSEPSLGICWITLQRLTSKAPCAIRA